MIEEINTDEFDQWLKDQADKHRMYPSDQLWRNINHQIHGESRWPALTFSAVLTGALLTAVLIFSHSRNDAFSFNVPVAEKTIAQTDNKLATIEQQPVADKLKPVSTKSALYSFNYTVDQATTSDLSSETFENTTVAALNTDTGLLSLSENGNVNTTESTSEERDVKSNSQIPSIVLHASTLTNNDNVADDIVNNNAIAKKDDNINKESAVADNAEELGAGENSYKKNIRLPESKKHRWNIEVYGGPNINYRRLKEPQPYDYHQPYNPTLIAGGSNNVNNVVKQRPSVGFNVGGAFTYALGNRVKVKAGLQFNFRQYTIDAFQSRAERSVLLMNNGMYYPDSVYTYSVISNGQGNQAITLSNRYYQIGVPIGLEWTMVKLSKVHLNVAASVQPTYQLNGNSYIITSDYKSYVQAPGLLRRWNINAGAEATLGFEAGGVQWQVGPQFLYQTLSTQKDNYSIQEHLVDYGIRIGVVKQLH